MAAQAWTELSSQDSLGSQDGLRIDMVLFRPDEIEGILLISASPNMERKLGLAMRLLKARIAFAAVKANLAATGMWKRAYQAQPLVTAKEIATVRRRISREAKVLNAAAYPATASKRPSPQ